MKKELDCFFSALKGKDVVFTPKCGPGHCGTCHCDKSKVILHA